METCEECGNEIDKTKRGWGHRWDPSPCGRYTFEAPPELIAFLGEQPKDATPQELTDAWIKKLLERSDGGRRAT